MCKVGSRQMALASVSLFANAMTTACDDEAKVAVCDLRGEWEFQAGLNDGGVDSPAFDGLRLQFRIRGDFESESAEIVNLENCGCGKPILTIDRDACTFQLTFWDGSEIESECNSVSNRFEIIGGSLEDPDSGAVSAWLHTESNVGCDLPDHPDRVTYMTGGRL